VFTDKRFLISTFAAVAMGVLALLVTGGSTTADVAEDSLEPVEKRLEAIQQLNMQHSDQSKIALLRLVTDDNSRIVAAGLRGLSRHENVPPDVYLDRLDSPDMSIREAAAIGLGSTRDPSHHSHLIAMLKNDASPVARAAAARGLAGHTNWNAVPALIGGLRDNDSMVRRRSGGTMGNYVRSFRFKANQSAQEREKAIQMLIQLLETNGVRTR
jgi:HEAT repeat protein